MPDLNEALGAGKALTFLGRTWRVTPLDFRDMVDIEDEIDDVELLDVGKLRHQLLLLWMVLRKADPQLGDDDRKHRRYHLTFDAVGEMVSATALQDPATVEFITECLRLSGMLPAVEAPEPDAKKKKPPRRSASSSAG